MWGASYCLPQPCIPQGLLHSSSCSFQLLQGWAGGGTKEGTIHCYTSSEGNMVTYSTAASGLPEHPESRPLTQEANSVPNLNEEPCASSLVTLPLVCGINIAQSKWECKGVTVVCCIRPSLKSENLRFILYFVPHWLCEFDQVFGPHILSFLSIL